KKYRNVIVKFGKSELKINPLLISIVLGIIFFSIAVLPVALHAVIPDKNWDIAVVEDLRTGQNTIAIITSETPKELIRTIKFSFLGYRQSRVDPTQLLGPYGLGASVASLGLTIALGLSIGLYYKLRSKNIIKIREEAKKLEQEFSSALFQLGNRLGDGLPAEIAFGKVANVMEGTASGNFFKAVEMNIRRLGMSVEQAIFDKRSGAILQFPSKTIDSSMKVLVESARKGPMIAAQALVNVSRYIKEIHKVDERLKDLLADIISDIKSQINFLTPMISGIVIGITSMITAIIGKLGVELERIQEAAGAGAAAGGTGGALIDLFGDGIPTYYFQIIVGIYVVQIIYILTIMSNGIENGSDTVSQEYLLGQNMTRSVMMYVGISLIVMILFNLIAVNILKGAL
ncbi:hypothetical protein KY308_00565, partial [Candidatus Woesearchaeota archaeon]|nr:hypothetical protein [Candidatus Woesearchaeota archaeon]